VSAYHGDGISRLNTAQLVDIQKEFGVFLGLHAFHLAPTAKAMMVEPLRVT
jgi:hypothetical protein